MAVASIKVDAEFKGLIPPLSRSELEGLEESLVAHGCQDRLVGRTDRRALHHRQPERQLVLRLRHVLLDLTPHDPRDPADRRPDPVP